MWGGGVQRQLNLTVTGAPRQFATVMLLLVGQAPAKSRAVLGGGGHWGCQNVTQNQRRTRTKNLHHT